VYKIVSLSTFVLNIDRLMEIDFEFSDINAALRGGSGAATCAVY